MEQHDGPIVIVTGAAGFIGRHVCRVLAGQGHAVAGAGRGAWRPGESAAWGLVAWTAGDITPDLLHRAAAGGSVTAIINCAGAGDGRRALAARRQGAPEAVNAVVAFARERFPAAAIVQVSSGAVYGAASRIPTPVDAPIRPVTVHGEQKARAEQAVQEAARRDGLRVAIVRPFSVYGEGLRKQLPWDACRKAVAGEPVFAGAGSVTRDWVAVEEVAALIALAADRASPGAPAVNAASGVETTNAGLTGRICDLLAPGAVPCFTDEPGATAIPHYAGDPAAAAAWGWRAERGWRDGIDAYARWFLDDQRSGVRNPEG
jgi:UDP-glucose 4-epimerase